jgi:RNA polymerase sigma-70 factor, ECF subfamily
MGEPARLDDPRDSHAPAESAEPGDFAAIVRREQAMVYSIARRFLRDPLVAEEVAQDVFLELHRHFDGLKSADHVTFWLRRVTCHRCIDYSRRFKRPWISLEEISEPRADTATSDPLLTRRLRQLIGSLPARARMVVVLRYQEDLTPAEIADVLAMPVATVKSHLQRSLSILREKIGRVLGDAR